MSKYQEALNKIWGLEQDHPFNSNIGSYRVYSKDDARFLILQELVDRDKKTVELLNEWSEVGASAHLHGWWDKRKSLDLYDRTLEHLKELEE